MRPRADAAPEAGVVPAGAGGLTRLRRRHRLVKRSEVVAREILVDIVERGLVPGDPLPAEAQMLTQYGVGRTTLREGLRLLEVNGLVEILTGARGGPVVGSPCAAHLSRTMTLYFGLSRASYEDLCSVILMLYPMIASVVARRRLTAQQVAMLRASAGKPTAAIDNPPLALSSFHRVLAELTGNTVWGLVAGSVSALFVEHIVEVSDSRGWRGTAALEHRKIAEAVIGGDAERAARGMFEHTRRTLEFYRAQHPGAFALLIERHW